MKFWLILVVMLIACHRSLLAQRRKNSQLPKCGKLDVIAGDVRTISPWTAAIFTQTRSKSGEMVRKFFTNGVILGPTTVLSLVGGPFGLTFKGAKSKQYVVPPPEVFIIGAGLNSTDVDETDSIAQFSKVAYIEPTRLVEKNNVYFHYFMYHLEKPLNLATPYVRHICIPLLLKKINPGPYDFPVKLVQGGFAQSPTNPSAPPTLKATTVLAGPKNLCESMFRYHYKQEIDETANFFCARRVPLTSSGKATFARVVQSVENKGELENDFCQLHGSSLAFAIGKAWYFATLVGIIPGRQRGRCGFNSFYIFGSPRPHLDWIQRSVECSPNFACSDSTCISLNKVCDGIRDCKDGSDEEKDFCDSQNQCARTDKSYSCGLKDKCISTKDLCNGKRDCDNGNDENTKVCQGLESRSSALLRSFNKGSGNCPTIEPDKGVVFNCFDISGATVDCRKAKSAGSKVELKCDPYHTSRYSHDSTHLVCNGSTWIQDKPFICEPGCGIIKKPETQVGLPWHVTIAVASDKDGKLEQVCSGTLIEKSFLITSTQCVALWVNNVAGRKNYYSIANPTTSVGLKAVDTKSAGFQISTLEQVWTYGNTTNSGLAVVKLKEAVRLNGENLPLPACYMVSPFKSLRPGHTGIITGFTLEGSTSSKPVVRNVTIVDKSECTGNGVGVRKKQFCVSLEEGFFPCGGDSGAGVLFKESSIYVLKGVATPGDGSKCNSKFGVVTNVDDHSDWILDILEANV